MSLTVVATAIGSVIAGLLALVFFSRRDGKAAERDRARRESAGRFRAGVQAAAHARGDDRTPDQVVRDNDGKW